MPRKKPRRKKRSKFPDKLEIFALVMFIFALFLLDVNANLIGAYGPDIQANVIAGKTIDATSAFWGGFIGACVFFLLIVTRSMYNPKKKFTGGDLFFTIVGIVGLAIILSGGMLLFWHNNALEIPFFATSLTRVNYYHIGIGLEFLTVIYFALTK